MSEYKFKWIKDGYVIDSVEPLDLWQVLKIIGLYEQWGISIGTRYSSFEIAIPYQIKEVDTRTDYNGYNEENNSKGQLMEAKAFTPEEMLEIAAYFRRRGFYAGIAFSGAVVVANKARKHFGIRVVRKSTTKN